MTSAFDGCTTEEQSPVVCFLPAKGLNARIFIKKCFLFTVGNVCPVKRFTTESRNSLKDVRKTQMINEEVETEVRKWLRQQSKDFYAAGFRRTGKAIGQVFQC
jgi:hypothetical protein